MPDARDLLHRWSRLKRAAEGEEPEDARSQVEPEEEQPDLPAVDELGSDSDYTAFMRPGVPTALRRAALRRAWSATPAIAGHKPLVDYDWDFHAPGYGQLWPGDDPATFVAALLARSRKASEPAPPEVQAAAGEQEAGSSEGNGAEPASDVQPGESGPADGTPT